MPAQVPVQLRNERNARLRQVFAQSARRYQQSFVGQTRTVLWEEAIPTAESGWEMSGLTDNYLRLNAHSSENLWNRLTPVYLEEFTENGLRGRLSV